mmetsp:Transcript_39276/g.78479  ORF Transcript_39276/g.78479 Transcript_39276/m.78479 type:complete len:107 (-) Transcript_39276:213-533(-)
MYRRATTANINSTGIHVLTRVSIAHAIAMLTQYVTHHTDARSDCHPHRVHYPSCMDAPNSCNTAHAPTSTGSGTVVYIRVDEKKKNVITSTIAQSIVQAYERCLRL